MDKVELIRVGLILEVVVKVDKKFVWILIIGESILIYIYRNIVKEINI